MPFKKELTKTPDYDILSVGKKRKRDLIRMEKCRMSLDWLSITYMPDMAHVDNIMSNIYNLYSEDSNLSDDSKKEKIGNYGYTLFECFRYDFPEFAEMLTDSVQLGKGAGFYDVMLVYNDCIRIKYNLDIDSKNGLNIEFPSSQLGYMCECLGIENTIDSLFDLLVCLKNRYCQVSRIDIALDDFTKKFTPKYYYKKYLNEGEINGKPHNYIRSTSRSFNFKSSKSDTFYIGSRKTGKLLRVYDKASQSKGKIDSIRYEIELHGRFAKTFTDLYIQQQSFDFGAYLRGIFEVIEHDHNTNISMCSVDKEWSAWLDDLFNNCYTDNRKIVVAYNPNYMTFSKVDTYFHEKTINSVACYCKCVGLEKFMDEIQTAMYNLPDKYSRIYKQYYQLKNLIDVNIISDFIEDKENLVDEKRLLLPFAG